MTMTTLALVGCGLIQSFGERSVLSGVDLELSHGEALAVVGVRGSGKSTLLYALASLRQPEGGTVAWGNHADIWKLRAPKTTLVRRAGCGFLFQFPAFLDDLTNAANVAVRLIVSGTKQREARQKARALLDRLGLGSLTDEYPSTLSGGELQRASIACALMMDPSILFCDEPTGALDEKNSELVVGELRRVAAESGVGVPIVTHEPHGWVECDRVLRLNDRRPTEERATEDYSFTAAELDFIVDYDTRYRIGGEA